MNSPLIGSFKEHVNGVDRTLLSLEINLLDYGADPTGVADSAPALTAALAALPQGGTVVAAGSFTVNLNAAATGITKFSWNVIKRK